MKKQLIISTALLLALSAGAQSFRFLTLGTDQPGLTEPGTMGMGISPDGRYVCGPLEMGIGWFIGDLETDTFIFEGAADEEGADLRAIDNNGTAIGFDGPGVTINIDGIRTELKAPASYKYIVGEDITNDGSILVGEFVGAGYKSYGAYCENGGEWKLLPEVDAELLGVFANRGSHAKHISGDGRVIAGIAGNAFGPATLWIRNDRGEYEPDPIFVDYCNVVTGDNKPYAGFFIAGLSNNGKYVLIQGRPNNDPERSVPIVYNTETKEMTVYDEPQENFEEGGFGISPMAIADNGLFVGVIGQVSINLGGFIMFPGETQAQSLADAYPEYSQYFMNMDVYGYHCPMSLTADGSYLLGYGYYSPDPYDDTIMPYFATYLLGTGYGSNVDKVSAEAKSGAAEYFTIDGLRHNSLSKGMNIVRTSDGKTRKIMR